jgi:hypothetical protein
MVQWIEHTLHRSFLFTSQTVPKIPYISLRYFKRAPEPVYEYGPNG